MISIKELNFSNANGQLVAWDQYVKNHPRGSFYHLAGWQTIFEEIFNHKTFFLYAVDDHENICGVLPAVLLKNIIGQKFLVSLPFMSYSGLLTDSAEAEHKLVKKAKAIGEKYSVRYIELRQTQPVAGMDVTKEGYLCPMLKLNRNDDKVWMGSLNAKVRNQVRQSFRRGITVASGDHYLDDFYRIFARTMHRLGTPVHGKSLFLKMKEIFKEDMIFMVAKFEKQVVAAMILLNFDQRILSNPWAASMFEYRDLRPNNGMYWEAIKYGCGNGFQYFDFGRSSLKAGTYKFKRQWGPEQKPLYYQYVLTDGASAPQMDEADNKYEKIIHIWQQLPYGFTKTCGPQVVKYLPEL